jgi:hypothetical protein
MTECDECREEATIHYCSEHWEEIMNTYGWFALQYHTQEDRADLLEAQNEQLLLEIEGTDLLLAESLAALKPFAYLARVMEEGQHLVFRGVYISYDNAVAAADAIARAGALDVGREE